MSRKEPTPAPILPVSHHPRPAHSQRIIEELVGEFHDAVVALLDKLDAVDKATSGIFVLSHIHGMPYTGPNWKEEYDRCRELTGTTKKEDGEESQA